MIRSFRLSTSVAALLGLVLLACGLAERPLDTESTTVVDAAPLKHASHSAPENPFSRSTYEGPSAACLSIELEFESGQPSAAVVINKCGHSVAVLTSPLEMRVRRTGKEAFINERMPWAAYGILYAVAAELGDKAFRGDGVVRDGGFRVRRDPAYASIAPRSRVTVPMKCHLDLAQGSYSFFLSTFEAPLREAPTGSASFDCAASVDRWNAEGQGGAQVSLGRDVVQIKSNTVTVATGEVAGR